MPNKRRSRQRLNLPTDLKTDLEKIAGVFYEGNMQSAIRRYIAVGLRWDAAIMSGQLSGDHPAVSVKLDAAPAEKPAEYHSLLLSLYESTWQQLETMAEELNAGLVSQLIRRYIVIGLRLDKNTLGMIDGASIL